MARVIQHSSKPLIHDLDAEPKVLTFRVRGCTGKEDRLEWTLPSAAANHCDTTKRQHGQRRRFRNE